MGRPIIFAETDENRQELMAKKRQPRQNQPEILTAGAQNHIRPIPLLSLQPIPSQPPVVLHVTNHRFNRRAPTAPFP